MKQCIIFEIEKSECGDFTRDEIIEAVLDDKIKLKREASIRSTSLAQFFAKNVKYVGASPSRLIGAEASCFQLFSINLLKRLDIALWIA